MSRYLRRPAGCGGSVSGSARWQILDTIATAEHPQPVAWLARAWGPIAKTCSASSTTCTNNLVAFENNRHHKRAQLVVLTDKGNQTFDAAMRLQAPWINDLAQGLSSKDIETFQSVISQKLERSEPEE
jgi:hypothetical protein